MSVVNVEFRASANFSELTAQVNRANASVMGLNATLNKVNGEKLADAFTAFGKSMAAGGQFHNATVQVISNTEKFGKALAQQKLTLSEYHRATSDFIRGRESQIKQLARQQVAMDRSLVTVTGHTVGGQTTAMVSTPNSLNATANKAALASKEMQIFNKVLNDGATSIINWGKNTQWAGRQLTVGLTLPLTLFGAAAGKAFMEADKQLVRMVKVYGDANTNLTNQQTAQLRSSVMNLGKELAAAWGSSINETLGLAADFAAVGKQGDDLIASTRETSRLMVLGEVDRQTAMKTTLSLQSAFKESNVQLTESINFLNAVENQTSATLEDLTTVIPKAGPVVRGLGGDVKDLALMFVAMKEGGVPAAESANAIKSGLASLINPTKKATEFLASYNINITDIIEKNKGKIVPTLLAVKSALDGLDPLNRARAIEMMFGKFQFARISALFDNIGRAGSQTSQVMKLMGADTAQLAQIADRELKVQTESASGRWNRAVESIKANMAVLGESILPIGTFFMNIADKIISAFNGIPDGVKSAIMILGGIIAIAGPLIMITGVMANFGGYIIKLIAFLRNLRSEGKGAFDYLTPEIKAAKEAGDLLSVGFDKATSSTDRMAASINELIASLHALTATQAVAPVASAGSSALSRSALAQATMLSLANVGGAAAGPGLAFNPINIHNRSATRAEVTGFEASHLFPAESIVRAGFTDRQADRLASLSSILPTTGYSDSARAHPTAVVQRGLKENMLASTIFTMDQELATSMETRRQMLLTMAGRGADQIVKGTNTTLRQVIMGLNPGDLKRLLPTVQDFKQTQVRYVAQMELLREKMATDAAGVKDSVAMITKAAKAGGPAGAASELAVQLDRLKIGSDLVADRTELIFKTISDDFYAVVQKVGVTQKEIDAAFKAAGARLAQIEAEAIGFSTGGVTRAPLMPYMSETGSARGIQSGIVAQYQMQLEGAALALTDNNAATAALTREELLAVASTREYVLQGEKVMVQMNSRGQVVGAEIAAGTAEAELLTIRNQQLKDLIRLINIDVKEQAALNIATAELADSRTVAAEETLVAGEAGLAGKSGGMFGGRGKMMGGMGALMGLSMIPMMLPDTGNTSLDTGKSALSGAGMGAMMGMMGGAPGAIIGAGIGAAIPLVTKLIDKMGEAERTYQSLSSVGEVASSQFGASIHTLSDVTMKGLVGNTEAAKNAVDQLAEAFKNAADGSQDKNFIDALASTDNLASAEGMLRDKIVTLFSSGMDPDQIRTVIAGAIKAAGKQGIAIDINAYLRDLNIDQGSTGVIQDKINDTFAKAQAKLDEFKSLQNRYDNGQVEKGYYEGHKADLMSQYVDVAKEMMKSLTDAAASMPLDKFMKLIDGLDFSRLDAGAAAQALQELSANSPEAQSALSNLATAGASVKEQLQGVALVNAGVIASWNELGALQPKDLIIRYKIYTDESKATDTFGNGIISGLEKANAAIAKQNEKNQQASADAAQARQDNIQKMQDDEKARQDAFSAQKDKVKERYDGEIQKLKDVEDARQKAFEREKKIADRQKQLRDMQIGYREAMAAGDFGAAALALNNMQNTQKQWQIDDSAEVAKTASDKKIAAVEKERDAKLKAIDDASKADKKASEAAIKNAQDSAKAADRAAKKSNDVKISGLETYISKAKEILGRQNTTFAEKWKELSVLAKSQGVDTATAFSAAFGNILGSDTNGLFKTMASDFQGAPWDLFQQLVAAKVSGNTSEATRIVGEITAWKVPSSAQRTTGGKGHSNDGGKPYASGGSVIGPGGPREDKIPAWLSNGEFVVNAASVNKYGTGLLHAINAGKFANGGLVDSMGAGLAKTAVMGITDWIVSKMSSPATAATPGASPPSDNNLSGNRALGKRMAAARGWGSGQEWDALNFIFNHESGWSTTAYDGAQGNRRDPVDPRARLTWGIPQAFPAHKMASAGPDWVTNPETQIKWGLGYIASSYTDPLGAYQAGMRRGHGANDGWGWYADGGFVGTEQQAKAYKTASDREKSLKANADRKNHMAQILKKVKKVAKKGYQPAGGLVGIPGTSKFSQAKIGGGNNWIVDALTNVVNGKSAAASPTHASTGASTISVSAVAPVGARTVWNGKTYNRTGGAHAEAWREIGGVNDIGVPFGTKFKSLLPGTVEFAGQTHFYPPGYVIVKNNDGSRIRYAHARVLVKTGDHVNAGDVVGTASTTNAIPTPGRSMTTPHLHFAWRDSSKLIQREHGYVPWLNDKGGMIKFANGGEVSARLLTGEHVMNRGAAAKYGHILEAMNNQRYHTGGVVTPSGPKRDGLASASAGPYNVYKIDVDARGSSLSEQAVVNAVVKAIEAKDNRKGGPRT